eukprot:GHVT01078148.1.p1 GENE.GHVT01078148.1~~GHVT01078148.1.p1  ORF type:complete len:501 (-),score=31.66 GHVT01078148.1:812-2314(-)
MATVKGGTNRIGVTDPKMMYSTLPDSNKSPPHEKVRIKTTEIGSGEPQEGKELLPQKKSAHSGDSAEIEQQLFSSRSMATDCGKVPNLPVVGSSSFTSQTKSLSLPSDSPPDAIPPLSPTARSTSQTQLISPNDGVFGIWSNLAEIIMGFESAISGSTICVDDLPESAELHKMPGEYNIKHLTHNEFKEKMKSVNNLETLKLHFPWLIYIYTANSKNLVRLVDIDEAAIKDNALVLVCWPGSMALMCKTLGTMDEIKTITSIKQNLFQLVQQKRIEEHPGVTQVKGDPGPNENHQVDLDLPKARIGIPDSPKGSLTHPLTECAQIQPRRLEEGNGDFVLFHGRVVEGAFNYRVEVDTNGEKLGCFDYYPAMNGMAGEEHPVVEVPNKTTRRFYVDNNSNGKFTVKLLHCAALGTVFVTSGLLLGLLWRRKQRKTTTRQKPTAVWKFHPRQQEKTKQGKLPQVTPQVTRDLDGQGSTTQCPTFTQTWRRNSKSFTSEPSRL